MKQKPRWTLEMLIAALAVLCALLTLALLVQRPAGWPALAVLVVLWGIGICVFRYQLRRWTAKWVAGGSFENSRTQYSLESLSQPAALLSGETVLWYNSRFRTALLFSSKRFKDKISELNLHINTDPLTGLHNRRGMQLFLEELQTMRTEFAVLLIDIDLFKRVNDTYGHDQGDAVLKNLAGHMKSNFRDNDICCRMGGEEFAVLLPGAPAEHAGDVAERLRQAIAAVHVALGQGGEVRVTASIGVALIDASRQDSPEHWLAEADAALYQAKHNGRNQVVCRTQAG